jgi:hypothetical protein
MTDKTNELGIVDTSLLTDADWAEINKLRRAHDEGGQRALSKALTELWTPSVSNEHAIQKPVA